MKKVMIKLAVDKVVLDALEAIAEMTATPIDEVINYSLITMVKLYTKPWEERDKIIGILYDK